MRAFVRASSPPVLTQARPKPEVASTSLDAPKRPVNIDLSNGEPEPSPVRFLALLFDKHTPRVSSFIVRVMTLCNTVCSA